MERQRDAKGHFIKTTKTAKSNKNPGTYLTLTPPRVKGDAGNKLYRYESIIYVDFETVANRNPTNDALANASYQLEEALKKLTLKYGWKIVDPAVSWLYEKKEIKKEANDGKKVRR
jgi:hypothetical protein